MENVVQLWFSSEDGERFELAPHPASPTFVTVSSNDPSIYEYIPETYMLGQISKFVQRGAHRVQSDVGSPRTVTNLAFLNPDGMMVLVVVNQTPRPQAFRVVARGQQFVAEVPDRTVATYRWSSQDTD